MEESKVSYYSRQVIEAMKYFHSENILHRDIKPENIMICEDVIKVGDFGWAAYAPK
jgi:serine/threonine protein kinase